jgi:glucosamine--fructose-6-phosphate aminotransferase (isomerizing)
MCQLAAYIGDRDISKTLLDCLRYQEAYFGSHATGMGTVENEKLRIIKEPGSVDQVIAKSDILGLTGTYGMAHSRFGISGMKDARFNKGKNAHPFPNVDGNIGLMHNGIISNYENYWKELAKSYEFTSYNEDINYITDSEVAVHMVDQKVKQGQTLKNAVRETANSLTGMVLLGVMSVDEPDTIYITNWIQACAFAKGDEETMFSSSPIGFKHVKEEMDVFVAPRNSFIKMTRNSIEISKLDNNRNAGTKKPSKNAFKDILYGLLSDKGPMHSIEIIIAMTEMDAGKVYGMDKSEWKKFVKLGWGDQNEVIDVLELLTDEGSLVKTLESRMEGGNYVPRYVWSLP